MHVMRSTVAAAAVLACAAPLAPAQTAGRSIPRNPVRIVIPFPTGGGAEQASRMVANHLTKALGQPFVVEARPGGNTIIGAEAVAKSAPDGYTLFVCGPIDDDLQPGALRRKLPYDPQRDFVPVGMVSKSPYFLVVPSSLAAKSLPELLALAKAKPGELSYASNGNAHHHHLGYEIARARRRRDVHARPVQGVRQAMPDLLSGRVSTIMADLFFVQPAIRPGSCACSPSVGGALAVRARDADGRGAGRARLRHRRLVRDVRAGRYARRTSWRSSAAEMRQYLATPRRRVDAYRQLGHEAAGSTPEALLAVVAADREKYARVIREAGIKLD